MLACPSATTRGAAFTHPRITHFPAIEDIALAHLGWLDEAIDTGAVVALTGIPNCTLTTWRCRGGGPPFEVARFV